MTKTILLTFDYELFLGKHSGSVEHCLIRPTNALVDVLNQHKAKGVFFIDTTYLYRLIERKNNLCASDLEKIETQLIALASNGHYLFHHLHPHWLDAQYIEDVNEWDLGNNQRFSFNDISIEERDAIFDFSVAFLKNIYFKAGISGYPDGYRAGGLFIEPFSVFAQYFKKHQIKYEFSVVPGAVKKGDKLFYDFSTAAKTPYVFEDKVYETNKNGSFIQYPVSTINITGLIKILNGVYYRLNKRATNRIFGDGQSVSQEIRSQEATRKKTLSQFFSVSMPISVEFLNPVNVLQYKKTIREINYMHFLSHPKLLTPISLEALNNFLSYATKKFEVEYDFKKIKIS
jgi:hypothetical protein